MDNDFRFYISYNSGIVNSVKEGKKENISDEYRKYFPLNPNVKVIEPICISIICIDGVEDSYLINKKVPVNVGDIVKIGLIYVYDSKLNYKGFINYKFINYSKHILEDIYQYEDIANFIVKKDLGEHATYKSFLLCIASLFIGFIYNVLFTMFSKSINLDILLSILLSSVSLYFIIYLPIRILRRNKGLYSKVLSSLTKKDEHIKEFFAEDINSYQPHNNVIALSNLLKTNKNILSCPHCHAKVSQNKDNQIDIYCPNCHLPLFDLGNIKCHNCHIENEPNAKFCNACGSKLKK